jgi:class 3 adenylate cyclase/tetratricopeptide (TPR) repeat protein
VTIDPQQARTDAARHARLAAGAPPSLAEKLRTARISGERRPVTVLFVDVVNSTTLAEAMDPEDWAGIMNQAFEVMSRAVYRYEGTIAQLMGDGMLAFFGAPIAHEDDPERAVRSALELLDGVRDFAGQLRDEYNIEFAVRAGINSGLVMLGNLGSDLRYEHTGVGDTMNVAARMQAAAEPQTVAVTEATRRLSAHAFEWADLGELTVKGRSEPIRAHRPLRLAAVASRLRGLAGLESELVGRDAELARLRDLAATVRAGRGRVALILGDAGIGKSRLLAELRRSTDGDGEALPWIEGRCLSYGRSLPYHLLVSLVRSAFDTAEMASSDQLAQVMHERLPQLVGDGWQDVELYLRHMAGLSLEPADAARLAEASPSLIEERYIYAVTRTVRSLATRRPIALVCDDVHWADEASVNVLAQVLALAHGLPMLHLAAGRPERGTPGWRLITITRDLFADALTEVELAPLAESDSRQLVANLLEVESLPPASRDRILAKAEGNPYFVEEIIRSLVDRGAIERRDDRWVGTDAAADLELPESLHGLLLARIDALPEAIRRLVRLASVIGRRLPISLVREVAGAAGDAIDVDEGLGRLEAAGMLRLMSVEPELEYEFRHALTQDAAYESLLRQERRLLHRAVGDVLESRSELGGERAAVLAMHFEQAGDVERAVRYLLAAGDHALERSALPDARAFYDRAGRLVPDDDLRSRVLVGIGKAQSGWIFLPAGTEVEAIEALIPVAAEFGDPRLLSDVHYWHAYLRRVLGETYETSEPLRRSLDRSIQLDTDLAESDRRGRPLALLGEMYVYSGEARKGIPLLEEALPIIEGRGDAVSATWTLGALGIGYSRLGDAARTEEMKRRIAGVISAGDGLSRIEAKMFASWMTTTLGDLPEALRLARECATEADAAGAMACAVASNYLAGEVQLEMGRPADAKPFLERSASLARTLSYRTWDLLTLGGIASVQARLGDLDAARPGWDAALRGAQETGDRFTEAIIVRERAASLAARNELEPAIGDYRRALAAFEALESIPYQARVLDELGAVLERLGRHDEAAETRRRETALLDETARI